MRAAESGERAVRGRRGLAYLFPGRRLPRTASPLSSSCETVMDGSVRSGGLSGVGGGAAPLFPPRLSALVHH